MQSQPDANDFVRQHGPEALARAIEAAQAIEPDSLDWVDAADSARRGTGVASVPASASADAGDDTKPVIEVLTNEQETNAQAVVALARFSRQPGVMLLQRAGELVQVVRGDPGPRCLDRSPQTPTIRRVQPPILRELLTAAGRWVIRKGAKRVLCDTHPPDWSVRAIHQHGSWPRVRVLSGVTEVPVLRPNGTVLDKPGYDDETGLLYEPGNLTVSIVAEPTRDDAERAAAELLEVVADFPFATDADRSAFLAAVLTPFCQHAIAGCSPLFQIDGNTRGTGKTKLVEVVGLIVTGRTVARLVYAPSNEELSKQITAIALSGDSLVLFDNIGPEQRLGGPTLDALLTGRSWKGRILGRSEMTSAIPMHTTWFATGNNVSVTEDTVRRLCRIRLESPEEHPEERVDFRHPRLEGWVLANRARLVAAALTILRAFVVAGRPALRGAAEWGSFEEWSHLVRGALVFAGQPDPGDTRVALRDIGDTDREALADLLECLEKRFGVASRFTAADLNAWLTGDSPQAERLLALVRSLAGLRDHDRIDAQRLGKFMQAKRATVAGSRSLQATKDPKANKMAWYIARVAPPPGLAGMAGDQKQSSLALT